MLSDFTTLQCTEEVKKIADTLSQLSQEIMKDYTSRTENYRSSDPPYQRISSLNQEIAAMHAYLNEVLDRLTWRKYHWQKFKKELQTGGWMFIGALVGVFSCHMF